MQEQSKYKGSQDYVVTEELMNAVNVAIALKKALAHKGEPGTGKTMLAQSIAEALGIDLLVWSIKSTTKAQEGLYTYDTVQRLYDSQFGEGDVKDIGRYVKLGRMGEAFVADTPPVLLIDEIDKADLEFPNDLLWELDKMEFYIPETKETIVAKNRPIVIITSNAEKELPDAFLRRCIFHYIAFPDKDKMEEIVKVHYGNVEKTLIDNAIEAFYKLREMKDLQKLPSTSELLDWLQALMLGGVDVAKIVEEIPYVGVLLKKNQDIEVMYEIKEKGYSLRNW